MLFEGNLLEWGQLFWGKFYVGGEGGGGVLRDIFPQGQLSGEQLSSRAIVWGQ